MRPALKTKWNSLSVLGALCVHVPVYKAFIVVTLEIVVGSGPQLICTDVGLWDMDRRVCVCVCV